MLSRFRTAGQQTKILEALRLGSLDLVIGTHRLLSDDLSFKDLGLLIIDEEQRFGVQHKEAIKKLKASVDVLTLSATPIPRTLYFAMVGARSMSAIETAPVNRLPIRTEVLHKSDDILTKAIDTEIRRSGQIFYLHNRVKTIHSVARKLEALYPKLRIAVGHGQMNEEALEKIMTDFVAGEYDILVNSATGGARAVGPFLSMDLDGYRASFDKLWGYTNVVRYGAKFLKDNGNIVLVSGSPARKCRPGQIAISSVGGAVEAFARGIAPEIAPKRINIVSPGIIDTPMSPLQGKEREDYYKNTTNNNLIPRAGTPDEVATGIIFAIENEFITATTIDIDGGWLIS